MPGAEVADIINNLDSASNANSLTQFFLGGLTQAQAMQRAQPALCDHLDRQQRRARCRDQLSQRRRYHQITSLANFQARYTAMLDAVGAAGPRGGVLIGVANVTAIPYFSTGGTYWAIKNGLVPGAPPLPPAFTVSNNCALIASGIPGARGDSTLVPFPYGAALIGAAQLRRAAQPRLRRYGRRVWSYRRSWSSWSQR